MTTDLTPGRRVYNKQDGYSFGDMQPGDYGIGPNGRWWMCAPNGDRGVLDTFHRVTEHEDGTITVSPSTVFLAESHVDPSCCDSCRERAHYYGLMHLDYPTGWHGWLERGIWREA